MEELERLTILLAVAGLILWVYLKTRPCNLRVVVRDGAVDVQGSALAGKRSQVADFFRKDLPDVRRACVEGNWDGRYLRLRFRGELSPSQRQRIRNFLLVTL